MKFDLMEMFPLDSGAMSPAVKLTYVVLYCVGEY